MKSTLLLAGLALSLAAAPRAHAQVGAVSHLLGAGIRVATRPTPEQLAAQKAEADKKAAQKAADAQQAAEANKQAAEADKQAYALSHPVVAGELRAQRTPADKLPKKGGEQITALEAELERCRLALQASPTGPVCTPEQRAAIQQAAVAVARAQPGWNLQPYQQEMAFYASEEARRQQAGTPAK